MCQTQRDPAAEAVSYDRVEDLVAALKPGMDLCTSDFTGWAEILEVRPSDGGGTIVARTREHGHLVHVPADVVIGIHHGACVRIDRARATIDKQGWEVAENPA